MRVFLTIAIIYSSLILSGQNKAKDIGVSFYQMTVLVFESEIATNGFDVGLPESIDVGVDGKMLKIQALDNEWETSNLIVSTIDGNYYTFDLSYKETVSAYFHPISTSSSTYKGEPISSPQNSLNDALSKSSSDGYFQLHCDKLLEVKGRYSYLGDERKKVDLYLDGLFVDEEYFYFKLSLTNRTQIKYNVEVVSFTTKAKERKGIGATSSTPEIQDIVYFHNEGLNEIGAKATLSSIYVIDKISLDEDAELIIDIYESNGSRERSIRVQEKDIRTARNIFDVIK